MQTFGEPLPGRSYLDRPSAYGLALDAEQRILVVETRRRRLYLPGGGLRHGETPAEGLAREFREEAGLAIRIGQQIGEARQIVHAEDEPTGYVKQCMFFLVEITGRAAAVETGYRSRWMERTRAQARLHEEVQRWALTLV